MPLRWSFKIVEQKFSISIALLTELEVVSPNGRSLQAQPFATPMENIPVTARESGKLLCKVKGKTMGAKQLF
ncbi:MAG: hypothetical protein ONB44_14260 [candidate division KSB1 bacterium]|nr:hypothetical protein [candidate division KSB1 bacterium]